MTVPTFLGSGETFPRWVLLNRPVPSVFLSAHACRDVAGSNATDPPKLARHRPAPQCSSFFFEASRHHSESKQRVVISLPYHIHPAALSAHKRTKINEQHDGRKEIPQGRFGSRRDGGARHRPLRGHRPGGQPLLLPLRRIGAFGLLLRGRWCVFLLLQPRGRQEWQVGHCEQERQGRQVVLRQVRQVRVIVVRRQHRIRLVPGGDVVRRGRGEGQRFDVARIRPEAPRRRGLVVVRLAAPTSNGDDAARVGVGDAR